MELRFVCSLAMKMLCHAQIETCDVFHLLGSVRTVAHEYYSKLQEYRVIAIYSISPKPLFESLNTFEKECPFLRFSIIILKLP
jgi:hypothetical protein